MADPVAALYILRYVEAARRRAIRNERTFLTRRDAFELDNSMFRNLFRLPKRLVRDLIEDLRPFLPLPQRASGMSVETRVLAALRFFAVGSYQRSIGQDVTVCLSQRSVSRCVTSVSNAMANHLLAKWVIFPRDLEELRRVKKGFMAKFNFPGVMGAIDCGP